MTIWNEVWDVIYPFVRWVWEWNLLSSWSHCSDICCIWIDECCLLLLFCFFFRTISVWFFLGISIALNIYKCSVSIILFCPLFPLLIVKLPGEAWRYVRVVFVANFPSLSLYDCVVRRFTGKFQIFRTIIHFQSLLNWIERCDVHLMYAFAV